MKPLHHTIIVVGGLVAFVIICTAVYMIADPQPTDAERKARSASAEAQAHQVEQDARRQDEADRNAAVDATRRKAIEDRHIDISVNARIMLPEDRPEIDGLAKRDYAIAYERKLNHLAELFPKDSDREIFDVVRSARRLGIRNNDEQSYLKWLDAVLVNREAAPNLPDRVDLFVGKLCAIAGYK